MNERMLELARQVWPDPNISHANHMKFAELIVRECLLKIENERFELPDFIIDSVKQHFGVEQ
jgi:hypothetical protein